MYRIPRYTVSLVRDSSVSVESKSIQKSSVARDILDKFLEGADRENFVVMLLDQKNKVIGINTVSVGSLGAAIVHPREVFKPAILSNCAAIILGHNHPSGDPYPSPEDRKTTGQLVEGGKLLGITVLDHIIIGNGYYSFKDEGLL